MSTIGSFLALLGPFLAHFLVNGPVSFLMIHRAVPNAAAARAKFELAGLGLDAAAMSAGGGAV